MKKIIFQFLAFFLVVGFFGYGLKIANPSLTFPFKSSNSQELSSSSSMFLDITTNSGLPPMASSTIAFGDYDNDGWVDMLAGFRLFRNVSTKNNILFSDVTELVGIQQIKGYPLFTDIDNNGYLDIVTTGGQIFLQKERGKFVESSKQLGFMLPDNVHNLAVVDFNQDGWIDILAGMKETKEPDPYLPPKLFLNIKGKGIIESTPMAFNRHPNYLRSIAVADYDNNGSIEAYFSNYRLRPNNFFILNSLSLRDMAPLYGIQGIYNPKKFFDDTQHAYYGPQYGHTISSIWADFDNDGNLDLWVSNLVHKFVGVNKGLFDQRGYLCDDSKIYRNTGVPRYAFVDMRPQSGIPYKPIGDFSIYKGDELWAHTTSADFNNDGLLDVYVSQVYDLSYAHSLLYKNKGNFKFEDVSAEQNTRVFDSYGAAWADLNNDGKMDLVQSGRIKNGAPQAIRVLQNIMPDGSHYLKVKLKGTQSGKHAVTAQVRVFHKDGMFLRQQEGVIGTMNQQNDPTLHFGLGKVNQISEVEVRWPSGKKQKIENVKVNQTITIEEPVK